MVATSAWVLMLVLAVLAVSSASGQSSPAPAPSAMTLPGLTATQAVAMLCSRQISAVEYVTALYDHYLDGGYECNNPFITYNLTMAVDAAAAIDDRAEAGEDVGPLCGLPLAVKDAIDVVGYPTTCATPAFADLYPSVNTPLVDQYLAANGIVLAKTNLGELQSGYATNPNSPTCDYCTTALNPYDPTRSPQGSSSGSGVALAARLAPLALCEDTGGSCLLPAGAAGLYTIRPTIGCYNFSDGLMPYQQTRDTVGAMARTADDLILLDSIIRNTPATSTGNGATYPAVQCAAPMNDSLTSLKGIRFGLPSTFGWVTAGISQEISVATNDAVEKLRAAGAELIPFDSTAFDDLATAAYPGPSTGLDGASRYESVITLARWLLLHNYTLSVPEAYNMINRPALKNSSEMAIMANSTTNAGSIENYMYYLQIGRPALVQHWYEVMRNNSFDAFLSVIQTSQQPSIDGGVTYDVVHNATGDFIIHASSYTGKVPQVAGSAVGFPVGFATGGTPVGMQIFGPPGSDGMNLNLLRLVGPLFGETTPPPYPSLCDGCTANVTSIATAYNGTGQPAPGETWTGFSLQFTGATCPADLLSYGQQGVLGAGPAAAYNGPSVAISGVTPNVSSS